MIAFLSDWGSNSYYIASAKAVIKKINPEAEIIDICHEIESFNIKQAAYILQRAAKDFPEGTVFLSVVDPSVGTSRKPVILKTKDNNIFIGPDNGLFTFVIIGNELSDMRELDNPKFFNDKSSVSFHGRDIFAPVAAHADKGVEISEFGSRFLTYESVSFKQPHKDGKYIVGEVAFFDHFGNMETNIPKSFFDEIEIGDTLYLVIGKKKYELIYDRTYYDVRSNELLAHIDGSDFLEIATNKSSLKELLKVKPGEVIRIEVE